MKDNLAFEMPLIIQINISNNFMSWKPWFCRRHKFYGTSKTGLDWKTRNYTVFYRTKNPRQITRIMCPSIGALFDCEVFQTYNIVWELIKFCLRTNTILIYLFSPIKLHLLLLIVNYYLNRRIIWIQASHTKYGIR